MDIESIKFLCVCGETHTPAAWSAVSWSFGVGDNDGIMPSVKPQRLRRPGEMMI